MFINKHPVDPQDPRVKKIRHDMLTMFEQSLGWEIRIKGVEPPLLAEITGVDWKFMMVKTKGHGDFHVDLCEITGKHPRQL